MSFFVDSALGSNSNSWAVEQLITGAQDLIGLVRVRVTKKVPKGWESQLKVEVNRTTILRNRGV